MDPVQTPWQSLLRPYRRGDWHDCVDVLRPHVDRQPDDLGARLLLAALYVRVENPGLAQLQAERALPLAVGRRDLFRAIGAQKFLDQLRSESSAHRQRYLAIHRWFSALSGGRAKRKRAAGEGAAAAGPVSPAALLRLPPPAFHRVAEECAIDDLGLEPRECDASHAEARVVLYGRVKWSVTGAADGALVEHIAEEGDVIALDTDPPAGAKLRLLPELPAACLRFDLAALEGESGAAGVPDSEAAQPAGSPAAGRAKASPTAVERPVPDPIAEPTIAVNASVERRRGTRVSVTFGSRVALIGISGTRVSPCTGTLLDLSPAGMGVGFPRAQLHHLRPTLEQALISLELSLPDGIEPLHLTARVRWMAIEAGDAAHVPDDLARLGLEFVLLRGRDRTRIQNVLIKAAREGATLGSVSGGKELDGGERAA